jgi:cell division protein FtsZ
MKEETITGTIGANIKVISIGGGGCKTANYLIEKGIQNIEAIAINTDPYELLYSKAHKRLIVGDSITFGRGTNGDPNLGQLAAEESYEQLEKIIQGADIVFILAGMGGGTGTGITPVVASIAKKCGALAIGIVTIPFIFEGDTRIKNAELGIGKIKKSVDTLITVSGDSLLSKLGTGLFLDNAFALFSDSVCECIQSITDLITVPGLINLDFADLRSVVSAGSSGLSGFGKAAGDDRARIASEKALSSLLGDLRLDEAQSVIFSITGGSELTLFEVNQAAGTIREKVRPDVKMIFGAVIDPEEDKNVCVRILATGSPRRLTSMIDDEEQEKVSKSMQLEKRPSIKRRLNVFLCHSSGDKPIVRKLYQRLYSKRGIDPWLDEANLLPGEDWNYEIAKAVEETDVVIVCISRNAVSKEGYVQKEIKRALDVADEKPEGTIFIIPLKVEECDVPDRLRNWQWVNYYEEGAFARLMQSLRKRATTLGIDIE